MSLSSDIGALTRLKITAPVSAANTAAATSAWTAVQGFEGEVKVLIDVGIITGTVDFTFSTNDAANGTGATTIVPIGGALAQVTTSNDDAMYEATFPATQLRGYLQVVGTVGTGPALVSYSIIGRKKY
jgi:hypothetical protein